MTLPYTIVKINDRSTLVLYLTCMYIGWVAIRYRAGMCSIWVNRKDKPTTNKTSPMSWMTTQPMRNLLYIAHTSTSSTLNSWSRKYISTCVHYWEERRDCSTHCINCYSLLQLLVLTLPANSVVPIPSNLSRSGLMPTLSVGDIIDRVMCCRGDV